MEVGVSLGQTVLDVVYLARFQKNGAHPSHRVTHQKQCARPVQIPFSSNRFGLRALFRYAVAFFITMVSGGGCIRAGPGGCYADGPVRHHRELSKSNFPPGLVWQWRNRWNPAAGDTSHSWTVRKMSKIRGSEISSVAANERDIHQTKKSANPANESGLRSRRGHTLSVSGCPPRRPKAEARSTLTWS